VAEERLDGRGTVSKTHKDVGRIGAAAERKQRLAETEARFADGGFVAESRFFKGGERVCGADF
jgi:hypothetical protein